ncbi:hypothetical protein [Solirubrobacter soli]|uniref:hypothetical protein n=1 Tax=Solirubrobacter soli TaxID=363832 RepID=UPI0003FF46DF|nr:hypothetical protein [Solirubrobacter soli]
MHVEPINTEELLARLRETRLVGFDGARVYEHATLQVQTFDPDDLTPAQRYVLMPTVRRILKLSEAVDVFSLDGGVYLDGIPLLPPVVERSTEPDGRDVWLINDGIHRVYAAKLAGSPINVVTVDGASHPYYALALPDGWAGVTEMEELPDLFQKKEYRIPGNYKALFRDFNAVFPGVQKERKDSNPSFLTA